MSVCFFVVAGTPQFFFFSKNKYEKKSENRRAEPIKKQGKTWIKAYSRDFSRLPRNSTRLLGNGREGVSWRGEATPRARPPSFALIIPTFACNTGLLSCPRIIIFLKFLRDTVPW